MHRMLLTALILAMVGFAGTAQAAGNAAAGKAKAATCAMCHGADGQGTQIAPKLAGMDPAKFVQALEDLKSGKLSNPMMTPQAAPLNTEDMQNLAAYYASLK